ncbi:type I 3-dehydroquinate dehydratase [uncultured Lactobacillus sp.]|uniref:type I 3-dehydroquinate dehydratase n=1 Tax=uncultured Lactobacillus sp. TaxID=153152 RepID=UPI00261B90E5|nr:type I 3-dehydroquinate dehydratase [uncultured Lactobacillus sp.]
MNYEFKKVEFDNGEVSQAVITKKKSAHDIFDYVTRAYVKGADLIDWRLDYFEDATKMNCVIDLANQITETFPESGLLITFRSKKNGGHTELDSEDAYLNLIKILIQFQLGDAVDIELNHTSDRVADLIKSAHQQGMRVIQSDFG